MSNTLWNLKSVQFGPVARPRLSVESLSISSGVTAILGQSGAGKTSLLNLLVGFESAGHGEINQPQQSPAILPLSWVPADFGLWPHLSVKQHLHAVTEESEIIHELLDGFDLSHLGDRLPATLSMGERARLSVARALASKALVHVMDEPFAHVDPGRIDGYWCLLRNCLQKMDSSLVFSSHSPHVVMREADRVVCLEQGQVTWAGAPANLYASPPTPSLAALLGPYNWLQAGDLKQLSIEQAEFIEETRCIRPEQIVLEASDSSELVVENSWFVGTHQESEVRAAGNNQSQRLYHRPAEGNVSPGAKVAVRIISACLLFFALLLTPGCRESSGDGPAIRISESRQYLLPAEEAMLPAARGMTYGPNEELLVLDNVGRVLEYSAEGELLRKWWMPEYDVGRPEGICVMQDGRIAIADTHYNRVVLFDQETNVVGMFGEKGDGPGQFVYTSAVAQDDEGYLYVAEYGGNDRVQKFTADGEFVLMFGEVGTEDGQFQRPSGIAWYEGVVYVADAINNRVQAFTPDGEFLRVIGDIQTTGLYYPYDISIGPDGSIYVPEYGAGRISRISIEGKLLGRYGHEGRGPGEFWTPWGIAVSPSGKISVADTGNRRVVELQL